ncbi:glycosyltransferase [Limnoglobus roseus]|uniref:GT2 and GT4 families glycosyltransferase n=1 Tax=Limnoglobus roseus TaxID=2598579 RepID=A0A5C1AJ40_9BACT|nr:glycosyltransferase [Limnoglobus roseus]QEL17134.1 GT2 and GT4 families glycosyltransferase [Limnoglobus roseus]
MKFTVVINTYQRARSLRKTLLSLRRQTYRDFEVVIVNGPSTDETEKVVAEFEPDVRLVRCPAVNLSLSRNLGIAAAAGDVVAFIDDDAEADPLWLEQLGAGYDSPRIGGVGGMVYDSTGYCFQYEYAVCDRKGNADLNVRPPLWDYLHPHGEKFVHMLGTNCSFRRDLLAEIGGFNEEFEYYLDETEVCMRLIDRGYWIKPLPHAFVYHRFLASHLRNHHKVLREPYQVVKNRLIFSLQARRPNDHLRDVVIDNLKFIDYLVTDARQHFEASRLTKAEFTKFLARTEAGYEAGMRLGLTQQRRSADLPPPPEAFRPFSTVQPRGRRMTIAFVSQEMPPGCGGIGRYSWDLATACARAGHEVHYVTCSPDHNRVDLESDVWVHRIVPLTDGDWNRPGLEPLVAKNLGWAAAAHQEVKRVAATRPVDVVSAPIWDVEGIFCQYDRSLNTVLTLVTTLQATVDLNPSWRAVPGMDRMLQLEAEVVRNAQNVTAPSQAILDKVRRDSGGPMDTANVRVCPLGIPDQAARFTPRPPDGKIRVLFVGRVEKRKAPDLLLAAAVELLPEFPEVEVVFVGNDTILAEGSDKTYRQQFEVAHGHEPFASRVKFQGLVSEDELQQAYADCDVFVLPARFESFGLVLVEAMAHGKPVIAANIGGMAEIVVPDENGFLVYPGHVPALVQALRRLIVNAPLRARMGAASRGLYLEYFTDEQMMDGMMTAYQASAGIESPADVLTPPFPNRKSA